MHFHRDMLAICDAYGRQRAARRRRATASSARRRSPSPSASAASCCSRCGSAPRPCCWRRPAPDDLLPAIAQLSRPRSALRRRPPIAPCCRSCRRLRHLDACANASRPASPCRRRTFDAWQDGTGHQADGRHRRDGDAAHLHRGDRGRDPPRRDRQAGSRL